MKSNLVKKCSGLMGRLVRGTRQWRSLPAVFLFAAATLLAMPATVQAQAAVGAKFSIANGWAGVTAASGGGNFIVALESDTVAAKVAAQLLSPSGTKIGSTIALGHDGQSCCASGAAFDGTNYLLAWEEDQGIKNSWEPFKVYGQFISAAGTTVGQAFAMSSAGITFDGMNMLAYGGGKYLLTYTRLIVPANGDRQDNRYVAGRIVWPDGTMGSEFRISQGLGNGSSVTFNGENFFVVWKEDSLDYEVRGRFVSPAGVPLGEISINASLAPSDNPVAVSFDGTNYMVLWSDQNATGWDVFAQRVSVADGSLVGGVITVNSETGSQMATSITFDGSNHLVTWIDMANDANGNGVCDANEGSCWDVYGQYIGKDGALVGGKFAINTDPGNQIGGVGCAAGKCFALMSSGIVMGQGGPAQVGDVFGAFLSGGTGASQFDGDYAGSWSKSCPSCGITASVGTFKATLANGVFSNIQFNLTSGDSGIRFDSGATSSSGVIDGTAATPSQCSSSVSTFAGQISITSSGGAEMAMTYSRPASDTCAAESGTITAIRSSSTTTSASLIPGWNLLGNGLSNAINVASVFGDTNLVTTVWKWIASSGAWAFYTPALSDGGAAYALSKGYLPLTTINGGEGFWVNAKGTFSAQLLGKAVPTAGFADGVVSNGLPAGWSLIAVGDDKTPGAFANAIALTPPAAGTMVATSLTTLWAWDASLSGWYFYAPSLVNLGTQAAYISAKGYLDFAAVGKTLSPSTGFWVNHP